MMILFRFMSRFMSRLSSLSNRLRRINLILFYFSVLVFILGGCAEQNTDQNNLDTERKGDMVGNDRPSPTSESPFDDFMTPGSGSRGGLNLISGWIPFSCVGYPIHERVLIAPWSCLIECVNDDTCDIAIMKETNDPKYYGLVNHIYRIGNDPIYSLAVLTVDEAQSWQTMKVSTDFSEVLNTISGTHEITYSSEVSLTVSDAEEAVCDTQGLGLFNEDRALIGLRLNPETCDQFAPLTLFADQLQAPMIGDISTLSRPEPEPEPKPEPEPNSNADQEALWSSEEYTAESNAPSCSSGDPNYCDGDVEMRCSNGVYQAFNCQRVGWICGDDSSWGPSCLPSP